MTYLSGLLLLLAFFIEQSAASHDEDIQYRIVDEISSETEGIAKGKKFPGFQVHHYEWLEDQTEACKTALTQKIKCADYRREFQSPGVGRSFNNATVTDLICDEGCGESLKSWYDNVSANCGDQRVGTMVPTAEGGYLWAAYNLTFLKDPETDRYCPDVVMDFRTVPNVRSMAKEDMCSYCFTTMFRMRQASPYALYEERDQSDFELILDTCGLSGPTDLQPPLYEEEPELPVICSSGITHTISIGETCDTIALRYGAASATIHSTNSQLIHSCSDLIGGRELCIPQGCETTYLVKDGDSCFSIEMENGLSIGTVQEHNLWIDTYCMNLQAVRKILGSVICLSPQGGYSQIHVEAPVGSILAEGTTQWCGVWYTAANDDRCAIITIQNAIPASLFLEVNPSLSRDNCDDSLVEGMTYCVAPHIFWDDPDMGKIESSIGPDYEWYNPLAPKIEEAEIKEAAVEE
ncbi:hypothetical protein BJY04DRAFT_220358 [Aspergillus karnatakaensis]|uniref:LysM peptidoglycan-binding domain-containing protein n=1 Tax=Aspergillus karnatakaensis TaxID=1810916 RepID=UPI003CCE2A4F